MASVSLPRQHAGAADASLRLPGPPGLLVRLYVSLHRGALDLVDRLRSPEPVAAAGRARLLVLLRDGCSPLYLPAPPEVLGDDLDRAHRLLAP